MRFRDLPGEKKEVEAEAKKTYMSLRVIKGKQKKCHPLYKTLTCKEDPICSTEKKVVDIFDLLLVNKIEDTSV